MSTPTIDRTGDWDSIPFSGGFAGLTDLADDEFSGMVTAGPSRLFMLRGAVIGILDGDIEDFEAADGTAREAPHPALPLLAVMQERADEVRAQYYTEETPISEVDRTLADGNFTGFIELSENVLSGDYFQVYHQGHSMSVAYVGASERLIVDDEAFEQADDEVGIYKVKPVDVEVIEIPEPDDVDDAGAAAGGAAAGGAAAGGAAAGETAVGGDAGESEGQDDDADEATDSISSDADEPGATDVTAADTTDSPRSASETTSAESKPPSSSTSDTDAGAAETTVDDPVIDDTEPSEDADSTAPADGASSTTGSGSDAPESTDSQATVNSSETASAESGDGGVSRPNQSSGAARQGEPAPDHPAAAGGGGASSTGGSIGAGEGESGGAIGPGDLETRTLPSLDPSKTASKSRQERQRRSSSVNAGAGAAGASAGNDTSDSAGATGAGASQPAEPSRAEQTVEDTPASKHPAEAEPTSDGDAASAEAPDAAPSQDEPAEPDTASDTETTGEPTDTATSEATSADLEDARAEVQRLESDLADLRGDHEDVVAERDRLESELAEAREEIDRLRQRLEDATGMGSEASQKLSPREAIDETNLFIRYDSKGEATLENAHAGDVDNAAVDENMRVEYHTSFDADDAAVDGIGFDQFLTDTVQYRFVDWLVRKLLYEIRDTGNTGTMSDLYDALPKVDRAELNGQVGVQYTEDGQEHRAQIGFDVIVRDRMGNPLMVANLNDSRDPATDSMMTDLVRAAERVGESSPSLAGAFLVTRSFFEPGALETAEEATAGGLLNRGKQKSFVNLSRKGGYHLCLVEARNDEFHLAVPEL